MHDVNEFIGKRYGNLIVVGADIEHNHKTINANHWIFKCDCGAFVSKSASRVLSGHCKSCGCRKKSVATKHGLSADVFYHTWWSMMQRCYNTANHNFNRYGGRGIKVCDAWHDVVEFVSWAKATSPSERRDYTLDRIDVNGDYCPSNCRWASSKLQANNRRNNTLYTIDGITKTFTQWCDEYCISDDVAWERIHKLNWGPLEAFSTPVSSKSKRYRYVTINGETHTVSEWSRINGIAKELIYTRIKRGMSIENAISTPVKR